MFKIKDIVDLQESYEELVKTKTLSKIKLCELCIPFRDKFGLTDIEVLRISRNEISLKEIQELIEKVGGENDHN
nr:MAG TPA: hypothetical protein [Caudoviricetes sp.]